MKSKITIAVLSAIAFFSITKIGFSGVVNPCPLNSVITMNEGYIGFGTSPVLPFEVYATNASIIMARLINATPSSSTTGSALALVEDDGAIMANGQRLGLLYFGGAINSAHSYNYPVSIEAFTSETWSSGKYGADLRFFTTTTNASSRTEKMRISAEGYVGIGNASPSVRLHVGGGIAIDASSTTYVANTNRVYLYVASGSNAQLRVMDGDGNVTDLGAINPVSGHEETVTYNEWTGEGQTRDIDALIDAVIAIAAELPRAKIDPAKLRWTTTRPPKDFDAVHSAIRADSIKRREAWLSDTNPPSIKGEEPAVYDIPQKPEVLKRWERERNPRR